ncbi:glycosyltransferase [Agromyces sp. C10]|uniref:glycosyltransferase n=1 Tax=Agromyces sp. C10 TaxID=2935077 RepID=UPI00200B9172|nr:glycosyltransferase [Agromyces sp. C10]MCK8608285.1 glycosyltransferase [Agromyces sp. C10]
MNQNKPTWSLITVAFNSREQLLRHWSGLTFPEEVEWIVVDNNSADDSAGVAAEMGAHVIRLETNRGFGAANNVGFEASRAEYVAFVNPDVTPNLADLAVLRHHLEDSPDDLVSPQLLNLDGSLQPNGRGQPLLLHKIMHRIAPDRLDGTYRIFAGAGEKREVDWLIGAVVAGTRTHLRSLGPWDEHFFVYYEDKDLGIRNALARGRSVLIGDARWVHGWARETSGINLRAWKLELSSMAKFYWRYPELLLSSNSARRLLKKTKPSEGIA